MTITGIDLKQFADKKVVVVHRVEGQENAVETEGKAEAANENGILIKPKGKTQMQLIESANIEDVRFVDEKPKALTVKYLKVVEFGQARAHLLERHAFSLTAVNAMSEKDAFEQHKNLDHVASDLGHVHGEKPSKPESNDES